MSTSVSLRGDGVLLGSVAEDAALDQKPHEGNGDQPEGGQADHGRHERKPLFGVGGGEVASEGVALAASVPAGEHQRPEGADRQQVDPPVERASDDECEAERVRDERNQRLLAHWDSVSLMLEGLRTNL